MEIKSRAINNAIAGVSFAMCSDCEDTCKGCDVNLAIMKLFEILDSLGIEAEGEEK